MRLISLPAELTDAFDWQRNKVDVACQHLSAIRAAAFMQLIKQNIRNLPPLPPCISMRLARAPSLFQQLRVGRGGRSVEQLIQIELTYGDTTCTKNFEGWTALGDAWVGKDPPLNRSVMTKRAEREWTSPRIGLDIPVDLSIGSSCCFPKAVQFGEAWPENILEDTAHCSEAVDLIAAVSIEAACFVALFTSNVVLYRYVKRDGFRSASSSASIGRTLFVNAHTATTLELAEALLHESIHSAISIAELKEPLLRMDVNPEASFRSPWTGCILPIHAALHAVIVWGGLAGFYRLKSDSSKDWAARLKEIRTGHKILLENKSLLATLLEYASPAWHMPIIRLVEHASKN